MSISLSSTTGFARSSPSGSISLKHGGAFGGNGSGTGSLSTPTASSAFKKTFAVSSLKSLARRQNYVLVLEFEKNLVSFHKVRRGKEVKRSFPFHACVKLEREAKNACQLTTTFGHEPRYKKSLFFATPEERELFCNLVHAMIVSGSRAVKLFKSLQSAGAAAAAAGGADGGAADMDFSDFLVSFSSAQTQVAHSLPVNGASSTGGSGGMTFDEEAELVVGGGRARANASDPQAAILAFLAENSGGSHADGGAGGINGLATSSLVSLLNGRMLDGEVPVNSSDITYRVECECGGIGQTVVYRRHKDAHSDSGSHAGVSPALIAATNGSSAGGNVEISSKDGTGITASSRGLFLLTNYRVLYVNYNENNSFAAHEAASNYASYIHTPGSQSAASNTGASAAAVAAASHSHTQSATCTCDGDIPLGLINRVSKSTSKTSDGCEIKLHLKDGRKIEFGFDCTQKWVEGLITNIQKMAFPKDQSKLFAFQYAYNPAGDRSRNNPSMGLSPFGAPAAAPFNGWDLYEPLQDYARITLSTDPLFRVVGLNVDFKLCGSYPRWIIEPTTMRDDEIKQIAQYRSQSRLPAVVWIHPITRASLSRCAQPLVGIKGRRSDVDEKLVAMLRTCNPSNTDALHIFDARPWKAAVGNTAMGKGFENIAHYEKATLQFCSIDNIHAIRNSLDKLQEVCSFTDASVASSGPSYYAASTKSTTTTGSAFLTSNTSASLAFDESFLSKLEGSLWLNYVRLVLSAAQKIAVAMSEEGASCITHCSDGWDRTSQLAALTELMLDPFYRTLEGFGILIEKEWLSFGHRFAERYGHASSEHDDTQRAPIFIQFLDCVYQLLHQFPASFEFNEDFLLAIHDHVTSHRFGTFLFNCVEERERYDIRKRTVSLWTFLLHGAIRTKFYNPRYVHPPHVARWNVKDVTAASAHATERVDQARKQQQSTSSRPMSPPPHLPTVPPLTGTPSAGVIASFFCIPSVSAKRLVLWEKMHLRYEREYMRTQSQAQQQVAQRVTQALAARAMKPVAPPPPPTTPSPASAAAAAAADIDSAWMARYNMLVSRILDAGIDIDKLEAGIFVSKTGAAAPPVPTGPPPPPPVRKASPPAVVGTASPLTINPSSSPRRASPPSPAPVSPNHSAVSLHLPTASGSSKRSSLVSTSQLVSLKASIDHTMLSAARSQLRSNGTAPPLSPLPTMPRRPPPTVPPQQHHGEDADNGSGAAHSRTTSTPIHNLHAPQMHTQPHSADISDSDSD